MSFENNSDNKNLFIAIGAFILFMLGYNYFFENNAPHQENAQTQEVEEAPMNTAQKNEEKEKTVISAQVAMAKASRIYIENSKLKASIDLQGGVIDSVELKQYKQTTDQNSANVNLLQPKDTENEFYYNINYFNTNDKQ